MREIGSRKARRVREVGQRLGGFPRGQRSDTMPERINSISELRKRLGENLRYVSSHCESMQLSHR